MRHALLAATALLFLTPVSFAAQDGDGVFDPRDILAEVDRAEEARWAGVRGVTQTLRTGSVEMTVRQDIEEADGERRFDWRVTDVRADFPVDVGDIGSELPMGFTGEPATWAAIEADEVRHDGTEARDDGALARIVLVSPVISEELEGRFGFEEGAAAATIDSMILLVDRDRSVVAAVEVVGTLHNLVTGRTGPYHQATRFEDFRDVDGLRVPWRTVMRMEMPSDVMMPEGIDPAEFRRQIEEMRALMDVLPEEERAMLAEVIEMSQMFGEDGAFEIAAEVVSIEVDRD